MLDINLRIQHRFFGYLLEFVIPRGKNISKFTKTSSSFGNRKKIFRPAIKFVYFVPHGRRSPRWHARGLPQFQFELIRVKRRVHGEIPDSVKCFDGSVFCERLQLTKWITHVPSGNDRFRNVLMKNVMRKGDQNWRVARVFTMNEHISPYQGILVPSIFGLFSCLWILFVFRRYF